MIVSGAERKPSGRTRCLCTVWLAVTILAAPAFADSGSSIGGLVRDLAGIPQMDAEVRLLRADGSVLRSAKSDYRGWFQFTGLFPGSYSVEVRQPSFALARKDDLSVAPGKRTFLEVSLNGVFASLQLGYGSQVRDMTDRWKWVLRAKHSRRNVLRFAPAEHDERERFLRKLDGTFEDTHAYAQLTAGQGNRSDGLSTRRDLGTAFAVATSLFGSHDVTLSGNSGAGRPDIPGSTTAFRTSYSKEVGIAKPEVALTVRQVQASSAAARRMAAPGQGRQGLPKLETFSLELGDSVRLAERLRVEYGLLFESVRFLDRLNVASPYAKVAYEFGGGRELAVSYASGVPPPSATRAGVDAALRSSVQHLGSFPRVTVVDGRPTVQRSEHAEAAYRQRFGNGLVEAAVYSERTRDAAISATVPDGTLGDGEVVPDLYSTASTVNAGSYQASGARVSYSRKIADRLRASLGYGYGGVLVPTRTHLREASAAELRKVLETRQAHMLLALVEVSVPGSRTQLTGSYQWASRQSVLPPDPFNDFASRSDPGLNISLRQPLPSVAGMPGKFEARAEFRNLLKAGYLPLDAPGGRILHLLQAIRSYSGALSYVF